MESYLDNFVKGAGKYVHGILSDCCALSSRRFATLLLMPDEGGDGDFFSGFSDNPTYENAKEIADALIKAFIADSLVDASGVDEIHIVFTEFKSMLTQNALAKRMLPLEVVESDAPVPTGLLPMYEFEPNAGVVLDALLPRYIEARVFNAMLQSAASEHAARRRAMKSATDNADELIKSLTRLANAARQAEITQEISEIVGGADALASASAGSE